MEMESPHNSNQAETAEPRPLSQPASYRVAQVWKDIEAETGFASYEDYLEFYRDTRSDVGYKLWKIRHSKSGSARIETVIYDLSIQENSSADLTLRCHCYSGTELIQALRKPPDGVCVQLVLWHRTDSPLSQEMTDTLGLGLRLDLDDFDYRKRRSPPLRKSGPRIKSIFGEQNVAAISQGFMRDVANEVPVVLVAAASGASFWNLLGSDFVTNHYEDPPFCKSPRVIMPFENKMGRYGSLERASLDYGRAVQYFIVQGRDVQLTKLSLLLASISPLLYTEVNRITIYINRVQEVYTDAVFGVSDESRKSTYSLERLDKHRPTLRRVTEVSEDLLGQFTRYLSSEGHSDLSNQPSYVSVVADLRSLIADARRLEAEVRDFKQIQVGDLALKESHKSIELSNAQIREAKSGKIQDGMYAEYADIPQ